MNTDWLKIRPFNGDIKNGFEELVCQLARAEIIADKVKFTRVAAPDGGVEAYCTLSNDDEYGWQAKFFSSVGNSQWQQLDKSFKTAFEKHSNLRKYFICIPLDRQDPRIKDEEWFMDKWNSKVIEWKAYANSKGREVEFEYWGTFELFDKLNKPENEGKRYYWFGNEEFSDEWFTQKLQESIKNLGKRYTPELNFDLPIAKVFEGLSRDQYFQEQFLFYIDDFLKKYKKATSNVNEKEVEKFIEKINFLVLTFNQLYEQIDFIELKLIDQSKLISLLKECDESIDDLTHKFYELDSIRKKEKKEKKEQFGEGNFFSSNINSFREFSASISELITFLNSSTVNLSNTPCMVLSGEAGIGKSHLLADITEKRLSRNQFSILLLGQHFTAEEPWSQIKKLLHISCERDTFLSALNSKAESLKSKILIFIDAINEGEGKKFWKNHISGFISAVQRFPHLGLVFSVRTSYENLLIPETLTDEIVKVVHYGFSSHEYEASKFFFENFEIKQPSIPLLNPEFGNPLFLKLFCEGLHKKGLHEIPDGYEGISTIINSYLDSINTKIFENDITLKKLPIVSKVAKLIAGKIAEKNTPYLKFEDAFILITKFAEEYSISDKSKFFDDLISEGLITQNLYWDNDGKDFEGVYLSYERFGDHLVCSYLIENYLDKKKPKDSFLKGTRLFEVVKDQNECYYNKGLIEALSIQLPEQIGLELYEVAEHTREFEPIASAFIESIIWRKKETIQDKVKDYINQVVVQEHGYDDYFLNTILLVTSQPNHYFNSDFVHQNLMKYSMADRDAWWTTFIHNQYPANDEITSIRRIIDWAWTEGKREHISDESIRLMCQTLFWFTTSTNRTLRDSATKALICLLEERINVLIETLKVFEKVNDPYVLQRLYAVAFGCTVRTTNTNALKDLGEYIYKKIFNVELVIPDILLRDYARNIIEFAIYKGHHFEFDLNLVRPPFKSDLPKIFPSNEDIEKYELDNGAEGFKDYHWSINSIIDSMKTEGGGAMYGDFGRYTFQGAFDGWREVKPQLLSNLAVKWIFEKYGYDVEKHGQFDRRVKSNSYDRHYVKEERIGKKYQWIAFHELLARVSDNETLYEDWYSQDAEPIKYEGPWEPYVRDIDPTVTIKSQVENKFEKFWWCKKEYLDWDIPNNDWIFKTDDLVNPIELINIVDPNGIEWLVLEMYSTWHEPEGIGEDRWENTHKELYYQIRSYITKKEEHKEIINWAKGKNFMGRWMPESKDRYELFSREYYWSPGCSSFREQGYREYSWSEIHDKENGEFSGNVSTTATRYLWEKQFDGAQQSPISFFKPTEIIFNLLDMKYSKIEGQLLNGKSEMICFDPCTTHPTHSCLVVRKTDLIKKLTENGLDIFWTVLGEKQILGSRSNHDEYIGRLDISGVMSLKMEN